MMQRLPKQIATFKLCFVSERIRLVEKKNLNKLDIQSHSSHIRVTRSLNIVQ